MASMLGQNKTLETLEIGNLMVGCKVKLKSSGEMCTVYQAYSDGRIRIIKPDGSEQDDVKPSEFEWQSQVPAFCAGLAASTSLLSVSACALLTRTILCADAFCF